MLKIGLIGVGHLGRIHLQQLLDIKEYNLIGFYDTSEDRAKEAEKEFKIKYFSSLEELIDSVDVVDIVTPTLSHFDCASAALKKGKHVFIEKPITNTLKEAEELIELRKKANVKAQIGHVERFNPAFLAAKDHCQNPMFIETHRLAQFNPRGTDVPVVLDLMIHDIDIVLSMVNSEVKNVSASGVSVVSESTDIANARIEFKNGCVANLTASRISLKNMRKSRFCQKDAYITIDFLDKEATLVKLRTLEKDEKPDPMAVIIDTGNENKKKQIYFDQPEIKQGNAIKMELESLAHSIINSEKPKVTIVDGYNALKVAHQIINKINRSNKIN